LVAWLSNPAEIDQRVRGTEMEAMIAKGAQQQRNGVLASLGLVADSLRMLPTREQAGNRTWSATEWAETRRLDIHHVKRYGTRGVAPAAQPLDRSFSDATPNCFPGKSDARLVCTGRTGELTAASTIAHRDYGEPEKQKPAGPWLPREGAA
jgi:hypothetical protein